MVINVIPGFLWVGRFVFALGGRFHVLVHPENLKMMGGKLAENDPRTEQVKGGSVVVALNQSAWTPCWVRLLRKKDIKDDDIYTYIYIYICQRLG